MWRWIVLMVLMVQNPCYVYGRSYPAGAGGSSLSQSWRSFGSSGDEIHHYSYGTEVPGSSSRLLSTTDARHRRLLEDGDEDEDDMQTLSPAEAPRDATSPEKRKRKKKLSDEAIAGGVFGLFFVTGLVVLLLYVCKTRKYIQQRREASLARARSLDFAFAADASASASHSPSLSGSPEQPSSYVPPAELALHPQASRGSSATLE